MRILFISNAAHVGGGNKSLISLVKSMEKKKARCLVVVPGYGSFTDELMKNRISFQVQNTQLWKQSKLGILYGSFQFAITLLKFWPQVAHFNDIHCYNVLGRICHFFRVRTISHVRYFANEETINFMLSPVPSLLIFNSKYTMKKILSSANLRYSDLVRSVVCYNFFEKKDYYQPDRRDFERDRLKIKSREINVLLIGNINPLKGHEIFLDSVNVLKHDYPELYSKLRCTIAGEDVSESGVKRKCDNLISKLQLENIHFMGFSKDAAGTYAAADIVVIPSEEEPFGRVAVEAILAEKKVVAFNNSGLKEILSPLKTPVLVDEICPRSLAEGIVEAAINQIDSKALKIDSGLIEKTFSEERLSQELYREYCQLARIESI